MEKGQEKKIDNCLLNVEVNTKTCVSDKGKEIKPSLEDTNCNLTIIESKDNLILDQIDLIGSCKTKLNALSLNGPKKLVNGGECENLLSELKNRCIVDNFSLKESSSHCKSCVNAGDNPCETQIENLNISESHRGQSQREDSYSDSVVPSDYKSNGLVSLNDDKGTLINSCTFEKQLNCSSIGDIVEIDQLPRQTEPAGSVKIENEDNEVFYVSYQSELQMPDIMRLIQRDLSEPYSIYTYRYFIHNWPQLCFLAMDENICVGAIVCKLDVHRKVFKRGYIAMLAVDEKYRKQKIGSNLVLKAIRAMVADGADEVVLETEITNKPALRLYENLGFVRDKRLFRYYLNGVDALRLKLWLR